MTSLRGAGNFHVFQSLFQRSKEADIGIGNTGYFSFRHNTSIGSKAFFVGNTFTCEPAITAKTNRLAFDDRVVDYDTLEEPLPELPGTPPNRKRPILEVPAGATHDDIQQAVDPAAGLDGQHPVVHLPAGDFRIARTLTLHGAIMACALSEDEHEPAIELNDFSGRLAFLNVQWSGGGDSMRLLCRGEGKHTQILALGAQVGRNGPRFDNQSPQAVLAVLEAMRFTDGGGATPIPDLGAADRDLILAMLAPTRAERPRPLTPIPHGATDVRLFRVMCSQGRDCLRLTAD